MAEHPITQMMQSILTNSKNMVDVNTVVGTPFTTPGGATVIPVCRVDFGFGSGGSDYPNATAAQLPFGGGGGAGLSVTPIAFLVESNGNIKCLPIDDQASALAKLINNAPELIDKAESFINGIRSKKAETPKE